MIGQSARAASTSRRSFFARSHGRSRHRHAPALPGRCRAGPVARTHRSHDAATRRPWLQRSAVRCNSRTDRRSTTTMGRAPFGLRVQPRRLARAMNDRAANRGSRRSADRPKNLSKSQRDVRLPQGEIGQKRHRSCPAQHVFEPGEKPIAASRPCSATLAAFASSISFGMLIWAGHSSAHILQWTHRSATARTSSEASCKPFACGCKQIAQQIRLGPGRGGLGCGRPGKSGTSAGPATPSGIARSRCNGRLHLEPRRVGQIRAERNGPAVPRELLVRKGARPIADRDRRSCPD